MLTIQPKFTNNYSVRPSFKAMDRDKINEEKSFYERQRDELDELLSDDYVPEKIKKPFKFFKMIANAAVSGLAVFGSALAVGEFFKGAGAKVAGNGTAKKFNAKVLKPLGQKIIGAAKFLGGKIAEGFDMLKATSFGQKSKELFSKFEGSKFGAKVVDFAKKGLKKVKNITNKILSPFKKFTYDKAKTATASVLGTGSGIAGGYEEFVKESNAQEGEEG